MAAATRVRDGALATNVGDRRRSPRWAVAAVVAAVAVAAVGPAAPARAATPDQINKALERAKAHLYSKQKNGTWEDVPARDPKGGHDDTKGWQWGGLTAVATYALLAVGENPQSEKLKPAIDFLKKADVRGVYALGMRTQVWHLLPQTPELKQHINTDAKLLLAAVHKTGKAQAMFPYYGGHADKRVDHSVSQYGVLGLWAMEQAGYEVPTAFWSGVDAAWKKHQLPDGGWSYDFQSGKPEWDKTTHSMTAAGIATLFITQDYTRGTAGLDCRGNLANPNIDKGMKWMEDNFKAIADGTARHLPYTLYGVERIGVASGYKYFGGIDWYQQGANILVTKQSGNGAWDDHGTIPGTAFGILFLARGGAPVMFNKLQYDGDWNQRPRDAANVSQWAGRQSERDLNWQIVNLTASADELHDAPILYVAGDEPLKLKPEDQAKIKQYVEQGGLLLANADCGNGNFAGSVKKLGTDLFPDYEWRELPADHLIYTGQQFNRARWKTKMSVLGLSNGVRELMLLIPANDAGKAWQTRADRGREEFFQLAANVFQYAVDKTGALNKGTSYIAKPDPKVKPDRPLKVARIQYAGAWDPEPAGWRQLAVKLRNGKKVDLATEPVKLGTGKLKDFKIAHLTGVGKVKLDEAAKGELKEFVAKGGTLIVDAAGGDSEFATAAEELLKSTFPAAAKGLDEPLKPAHPIYAAPDGKVAAVQYRPYAQGKLLSDLSAPRIRGLEVDGRTAVFYSREDLSAGLVGQQMDGILGYTPDSATQLMTDILLHASKGK